eukprot:SAG11_NODE_12801_length_684_cov_5.288889_2_plen_62_part_01
MNDGAVPDIRKSWQYVVDQTLQEGHGAALAHRPPQAAPRTPASRRPLRVAASAAAAARHTAR